MTKKRFQWLLSQDFISIATSLKLLSVETLRKANLKEKSDLIVLIKWIISQWLMTISNVDKVLLQLATLEKIPYIKYDLNEDDYMLYNAIGASDNKPIKFWTYKDLSAFIRPFYEEAKKDFKFDSLHTVILDMDHKRKIIKVLTLIPSIYVVKQINAYKANSKLLREKRTIYYEDYVEKLNPETGKIEKVLDQVADSRTFEDYAILPITAPYKYIQELIYNSQDVWEWLSVTAQKIQEQQEKAWISWKKEEIKIYTIENSLAEDEWSIDSLVYRVLKKQFEADVSDIHIEPLLDSTDPKLQNAWFIRYRIDWDLQWRKEIEVQVGKNGEKEVMLKPQIPDKYDELIKRLKEKSGIPTDGPKADLPGDGKLKVYIADRKTLLEYRVSTLPQWVVWQGGKDKMVLRKLERWTQKLDLVKMNMDPDKKAIIDEFVWTRERAWRFNNGLILMTWPTGSWKSTTLFSILNQINRPTVNIQTLEDPIEYVIPWINQSQIMDSTTNDAESDTFTYHKGMKASLRQDPDIILIWEIRDEVTMDIAKEAADTWHLVFSSLHTNDTYKTLDRLAGIWFDMKLVWNIIRLIMAQRLWKLVCERCIREYNDPIFSANNPTEQALRDKEYLEMKMDIVRKLLDSPYVVDLPDKVEDIKLYQWLGVGCSRCNEKWTKWRVWIYEFLDTSDVDVSKFILKYWTSVDNETIKNELFIPKDITTLHQNALIKCVKGIKTYDWQIRYMNYYDALAGAGADAYEWDKDYKDASLEELNLLLKDRKIKR